MAVQKRDVSVYRLIATGTMEELIYTRQVYKQQQTAVATEGMHERRYFEGPSLLMPASCQHLCNGEQLLCWWT